MAGFRSHRSRFRREKLSDQLEQEQNSMFCSTLGQKLATFKTSPDPDLEQKFNLVRSRPLFIGACATCTVFSNATYLPESVYNFTAVQDSLIGDVESKPELHSRFVIDFRESFQNNEYVKACLQQSNAGKETDNSFSSFLEEFVRKQSIQQEEQGKLL